MPHGISIVIAPLELLLQLQLPTKMPQQHISSSLSRHCGPATACDTTLWQPRCLDNICTCFAKLQAHDVPAMPQHQLLLSLLSFPLLTLQGVRQAQLKPQFQMKTKWKFFGELLSLWLQLRLTVARQSALATDRRSLATCHLPLTTRQLPLATCPSTPPASFD